ncbi:hypothetical protein P12x_001385 [Tundrisphaera lichenicola]|uniref:hypothetical protein n=1 Tax=Tundrisphaera lichenicola TaxID=2029860 RepID=UPI003EB9FCF5
MDRIPNRGWLAIFLLVGLIDPGAALGQGVPESSGASGAARPPQALLMNPYLNPYMNPYLNPGATQQNMSPSDALLYLYAAQSATGGIGSGLISGSRPTPGRTRAIEKSVSTAVPGGGASGFFNPGPVNVNGAGRYFNRRSPHGRNNGK